MLSLEVREGCDGVRGEEAYRGLGAGFNGFFA